MRPIDSDALKVRMFRSEEFNRDTGSFDLPVVPWHDIEDAETLDYAPVRHGEWIEDELEYPEEVIFRYKCSECGRTELVKEPYCHCGARMDGGEKDG